MQLLTEELQYLEISLWKDYNETITVKRNQLKQKRDFKKLFREADNIIKDTQSRRIS